MNASIRSLLPCSLIVFVLGSGCAGPGPEDRSAPDAVTWESPPERVAAPTSGGTTASGLSFEILRAGTGKMPKASDRVQVHYQGFLLDGTVFDSSVARGEPDEFGLNQVIRGWTEGLQLMQEGAKFRFRIPPHLAYGPQGMPPKIGPNETLVFEVELLKVLGQP